MFRNISFVWKPKITKLREPTETEELPVWGLWFTIILLHIYNLENDCTISYFFQRKTCLIIALRTSMSAKIIKEIFLYRLF